jgi:hypothetical protein
MYSCKTQAQAKMEKTERAKIKEGQREYKKAYKQHLNMQKKEKKKRMKKQIKEKKKTYKIPIKDRSKNPCPDGKYKHKNKQFYKN